VADVSATLRKALTQLQGQRSRLDRQISALQNALAAVGGGTGRRTKPAKPKARRARRKLTAAQKTAISKRMKAYWAKRKKA